MIDWDRRWPKSYRTPVVNGIGLVSALYRSLIWPLRSFGRRLAFLGWFGGPAAHYEASQSPDLNCRAVETHRFAGLFLEPPPTVCLQGRRWQMGHHGICVMLSKVCPSGRLAWLVCTHHHGELAQRNKFCFRLDGQACDSEHCGATWDFCWIVNPLEPFTDGLFWNGSLELQTFVRCWLRY